MNEENKLPRGWVGTTLGSVAAINPGMDISKITDSTLVSFVPMASVEAGTGRMDISIQRHLSEVKRGYTAFQEGDVLFAKITPCMENGKSAVARSLSSGIGFGSTEFHVLRPIAGIDPQLLYYYISQESFRQTARTFMTGSAGQLRVPAAFLVDEPYPLPPLPEQHRIVAAIEQQFSRLDAGVAALRRAQAKLKRYRAAVLKAAVEGKLTEAWRAKHPATEPASNLLERILAERRAKWEADLRAKGKDPAKVRYIEPARPDVENLPELPEGWCWAMFGNIGRWNGGGTPSKARKQFWTGGNIPWVSPKDMKTLRITDTEDHISATALEETLLKLCPAGTVLIVVRSGILQRTLPVAVSQVPVTMNQDLKGIYPEDGIDPMYIAYALIASERDILSRCSKDGTTVASIESESLKTYPLPLSPFAEQQQIVAEVERRLSVVSQLEATVEANLKRAERLRQSILKEAFAGRLVPQDPNDEPASMLLERIRADREKRKHGTLDKGRMVICEVTEPEKIDVKGTKQVELWESCSSGGVRKAYSNHSDYSTCCSLLVLC